MIIVHWKDEIFSTYWFHYSKTLGEFRYEPTTYKSEVMVNVKGIEFSTDSKHVYLKDEEQSK